MEINAIVSPVKDLPAVKIFKNDIGIIKKPSSSGLVVKFLRLQQEITLKENEVQAIDPANFGDAFPEKICNVCHRILPTVNFDLNQNGKGDRPVRRPSCTDCRKAIDGVGMTASDRNKWKAVKPHLVDFECPICFKITIPGLNSKVVLNHDHSTGKPTGWICDSCNTGLGRFKDDISILENAIAYLLKFTDQE